MSVSVLPDGGAGRPFIVRKRVHDRGFVQLDHRLVRDARLSWKARGLAAYLLSLPDNWRVNLAQLTSAGPDGRDATRTAMVELERFGYVERDQLRDDAGRVLQHLVYVFECPPEQPADPLRRREAANHPQSENPKVDAARVGLSESGKPTSGKPDGTKNESLRTPSDTNTAPSVVENVAGVAAARRKLRQTRGETA